MLADSIDRLICDYESGEIEREDEMAIVEIHSEKVLVSIKKNFDLFLSLRLI